MNNSFRAWFAPLVSPLHGRWGATFNDLTPEQKEFYREANRYYQEFGDSEFSDVLGYLNRNKFTYKITHLFRRKGGRN